MDPPLFRRRTIHARLIFPDARRLPDATILDYGGDRRGEATQWPGVAALI